MKSQSLLDSCSAPKKPHVPGRRQVDAGAVLGTERESDEAADDECGACGDRQPDLRPVGLGCRADELRPAGGTTSRSTDRPTDSAARRRVDGRDEHRRDDGFEDEQGDSESDDDALHGRSAVTRSPERSPFATKPHAHDVAMSSP